MAQYREAYQRQGHETFVVPTNSTAFASGDAVIVTETTGRLALLTAVRLAEFRFAGFVDDKWSQQIAINTKGTATAYSDPDTYNVKLRVHNRGMFKVAISDTSGYAGAPVYYSSGGTGAQIFTTTKPASAEGNIVVGEIAKDFSGATANDSQEILIRGGTDKMVKAINWFLRNHIAYGLKTAFDTTSHVSYASGGAIIDGKYYTVAYASAALDTACVSHIGRRCVLYILNSSGTPDVVDTGGNTWSGAPITATALQDSAYWPTTSHLIFAVGYYPSESTDLHANHIKTVRRSVTDVMYRRYINNG